MDLSQIFGFIDGDPGKVVSVPGTLLSQEQLSLFNGFDEIGGDTTKFDDAVEWYKSTKYKNEAAVLCIVVLDKPTSYVFGGMNKAELNEFSTVIGKLQEHSRELEDPNITPTGRLMKIATIKNLVDSCNVLEVQDGRLAFTGENKTCLDQVLLRSMPLYTDSEIESFSDSQLQKMRASRMFWEGNFSLVNVSRMKRLAMIYMELTKAKHLIKQSAKWINKHGGIPSKATKFGKNEETVKILQDDIKNLVDNKELWKKHKKVFNTAMTADNMNLENTPVLTRKQQEFVQKMGGGNDLIENLLNRITYMDEDSVNNMKPSSTTIDKRTGQADGLSSIPESDQNNDSGRGSDDGSEGSTELLADNV